MYTVACIVSAPMRRERPTDAAHVSWAVTSFLPPTFPSASCPSQQGKDARGPNWQICAARMRRRRVDYTHTAQRKRAIGRVFAATVHQASAGLASPNGQTRINAHRPLGEKISMKREIDHLDRAQFTILLLCGKRSHCRRSAPAGQRRSPIPPL